MTLIFSSGGGRLGNQLLNLIHLTAIANEYDIKIKKVSDLFIEANDKSLIFNIESQKINWRIVSQNNKKSFWHIILLKLFIRIIHFLFFLSPKHKSYKIGLKNNYPKLLIGENLNKNFSFNKLIDTSRKFNVVLSGWGLRNWDLVRKNKKIIIENLKRGLQVFPNIESDFKNDYLFIHIRRTDFLEVNAYKELNFADSVWIKSIKNIAEKECLNKVIIFSDSNLDNSFNSSLKKYGIEILFLGTGIDRNNYFLETFISYLYYSKAVICNASTLVLAISFLYKDSIYLPSNKMDFQEVFLDEAYRSFPSCLNWK